MIREFDGKVALVTGAASGLGRATALALAREGAAILLVDINRSGLDPVEAEIAGAGGRALSFDTDIVQQANCAEAVARAVAGFGRLDILCNIAGIVAFQHLAEVTPDYWERALAVNLSAPFWLCQAAMPHLIEAHGAIVNVSSAAGLRGQAYMAAYTAGKAGLIGLTKSLAMEFMKHPVRINAIAPGSMITGMVRTTLPDEIDPEIFGRIPAIRPPSPPEDMVDLILYLASDRARAVHGACFAIDSGMTVG